ncbi:MAG: helix-turn-helix domain-containing protein [Candidatus Eremiobacteraeota bacterium]|nr:helix-turn-helix domain-containing protein [Candidatus Eremiobacteraeota bacterium]
MFGTFEWAQLEPGQFAHDRKTVDLDALALDRSTFSLGFKARSSPREGSTFVTVAGDRETQARWFGNKLGYGHIAGSDGALDVTTTGPSAFYSVVLDRERLAKQFHGVEVQRIDAEGGVHILEDAEHAGSLRLYIRALLRNYDRTIDESKAALHASIRHTLLPLIALTLEERVSESSPRAFSRRVLAVRKCEEFVIEHIDSNPSLLDLSKISGFRLRSLINAFRAVTGLSPMAYLKRQRLNAVRRALVEADPTSTRIIDVAANWGFWHMGHFTADYRALFGETPSETLKR